LIVVSGPVQGSNGINWSIAADLTRVGWLKTVPALRRGTAKDILIRDLAMCATRFTTISALLTIAALISGACRSQPKTKPLLVGWRPISTFSGHGNAQTDSFDIASGQWRIKWAITNENPPGAGTFEMTVHSAISGRPLGLPVEHRGIGHGIAYINEDPRLYHLVIESSGVDWSVSVEDSVLGQERSLSE
jgi:hypothetical protein